MRFAGGRTMKGADPGLGSGGDAGSLAHWCQALRVVERGQGKRDASRDTWPPSQMCWDLTFLISGHGKHRCLELHSFIAYKNASTVLHLIFTDSSFEGVGIVLSNLHDDTSGLEKVGFPELTEVWPKACHLLTSSELFPAIRQHLPHSRMLSATSPAWKPL